MDKFLLVAQSFGGYPTLSSPCGLDIVSFLRGCCMVVKVIAVMVQKRRDVVVGSRMEKCNPAAKLFHAWLLSI